MRNAAILGSLLVLVACVAQQGSQRSSFESAHLLFKEQWQEHRETEEYARYDAEWLRFNNANRIDEQGGCYALSRASVDLILVHNETGEVESVVPKQTSKKAECFVNVFRGRKYPAPPYAPFYQYLQMGGGR